MFAHGSDGGLSWAEAGELSFAGWVLNAVAYIELCSLEYGVCYPGAYQDCSQEAS